MLNNEENLKSKFIQLKQQMKSFNLPSWEQIPDIGLYMDQIIILLNQYLEIFEREEDDKTTITPSMINNYVKMKIVPAPVKKKYFRVHLAYLIIVCMLKQTLNISVIQKLIPIGLENDQIKQTYTIFLESQNTVFEDVNKQIDSTSEIIFNDYENNSQLFSIIIQTAILATISKTLTEKMTLFSSEDEK